MRSCCTVFVLGMAVLLGLACHFLQQSPSMLMYRVSTSAVAIYALLTLPQKHIDEFLKSYEIFDQENITGNEQDAQNIVNYYKVLNHLCAIGQVEKMYIPPVVDLKANIFENQRIWEERTADWLDLAPGKKVLDVGCGRGRVAHHMAEYAGVHVTGLNIDKTQLGLAREFGERTGMADKLEYLEGNYNKGLPFQDETFDALYHVQVLTYVEDLVNLLKDMNRVLKPGAKISFLDWFALDDFDPKDPHHQKLLKETKAVIGAVRTPYPWEYHDALKEAGFEVLVSREASTDGGHQWPLILEAKNFFVPLQKFVSSLVDMHILPNHLKVLLERLNEGGESMIESDKKGLFTTSWQIIAQKPHS